MRVEPSRMGFALQRAPLPLHFPWMSVDSASAQSPTSGQPLAFLLSAQLHRHMNLQSLPNEQEVRRLEVKSWLSLTLAM